MGPQLLNLPAAVGKFNPTLTPDPWCETGLSFLSILFIYLLFYGCIGSSLLPTGFLSSCGDWGLLLVVMQGLLIAVASLVAEHRL